MHWENIALVLLLFPVVYYFRRARTGRYPPGPRGIPVLGNLFQLDNVKSWHTFTKWKELYGPIIRLNIAGQPMVIINSKKVAEDLFDRRGSNYIDRHRFIVLEKTTGDSSIAFMGSTERWRRMRRASEHALGAKISSNYYQTQTNESILLAHGIMNQPNTWLSQIERASSSTSLSMIYDLPPLNLNDPTVEFMSDFADCIGRVAMPGNYLVDMLPFLEHFPRWVAKWKRDAEKNYKTFTSKFENMFLRIKDETMTGNEQRPSFCVNLAENQQQHGMSDTDCAWLAGVLYGAGHETTSTTMAWFIFSMIQFPQVQARAHEELDRVVGLSRLPSFADIKHLPYMQAIVKEVLRWRPALPTGIPRIPIQDNYYEGYLIPKGTICIPYVWSINRDPEVYGPDADEFHPERHLDHNGRLKDEKNEGHVTYGFGQRICVGRHVANNGLFIQIAMILWTMRLEPAKDDDGDLMKPDVDAYDAERSNGIFLRPPPLQINSILRFQEAGSVIQQARDEIMEEVLVRPMHPDI
ncbi:cytochrome P450 [Dendrothele bispora CBS 962.96]|uniref:Cytochrome P450 n=1 Tax=Dendrothele bispora (strain CBS 962.96) TaxID=1314807 RepID=A0A4S8LQP4_DENBC|nr:cytochrome P450 [Dendrothele bispora CBS 962.96]